MLENTESPPVVLAANRRYFIEDKFLILDCFYDKNVSLLFYI